MKALRDTDEEERLGKALIRAYSFEFFEKQKLGHSHKIEIRVRNPKFAWGNRTSTYTCSSWFDLLFGTFSLNEHLKFRQEYNFKIHDGDLIKYSSLQELDVMMTLAGCNNAQEIS